MPSADLEWNKKTISSLLCNGKKDDEFQEWYRICQIFLNASHLENLPSSCSSMMSHLCLWFVCYIAQQARRQSILSKRSKTNVLDVLQALISVCPNFTKSVLKREIDIPLTVQQGLHQLHSTDLDHFQCPITKIPPSSSLDQSTKTSHPVTVQLLTPYLNESTKKKGAEDDFVERPESFEVPQSLREMYQYKKTLWPSHFPNLPSSHLTLKKITSLSTFQSEKTNKQAMYSDNEDTTSSLQVRYLEDKLHVQLLLPQLSDPKSNTLHFIKPSTVKNFAT